ILGLDETNLANFGSELEREHRKAEGALETAWNYESSPIGHQIGMWIWRVQNFNLIKVPEKQMGYFYDGDSYVILKTTKKENTDGFMHNIHFWLGMETSQDEAVLDTYATQHREVQFQESSLFKSYFHTLTYLKGGFASGFNHVEEEESIPTRLLKVHRPRQLAGSRTRGAVVISEVTLSYESLSSTEQGRGSGEREFFEALGSNGPISDEEDQDSQDNEQAEDILSNRKLLRLSSSGPVGLGHLKFEMVAEGKITKDMFDTNDVFVFDVGHQVYTWIGRNASRKEKKHGLEYAQNYIKSREGRSAFTPICQVVEGGEDDLFESSLEGWQGW
ncbi:hypothetical protein BDF20DRAFT_810651, partial [Mycotypha africana]|uniref:uncharacterized protein n=1 Tax=Mycotypha africana TaxID=64632 RepID=UPI002300CCAF